MEFTILGNTVKTCFKITIMRFLTTPSHDLFDVVRNDKKL
jgi:hypothetical protein